MKILMRGSKHEKWQLVQSAAYGAETELQELLAEEPSLISINEVREGAGNLVVAVREFPLDIGAVDLVGFTAAGDIAVVECKLASNDEIKRKVIGQVLEYGANLWGMDYETLDQKVLLRTGKNLADIVRDNLDDPEWDEEAFRANVQDGLEIGNFILVIVVDEIREGLSRIVRFINNDAGKPAFSLAALEMRRFQRGAVEMLVPHVFGSAPKPKTTSTSAGKKKWDEDSFFSELAQLKPDCVEPARNILAWANNCAHITRIYWGEGKMLGTFVPMITHKEKYHQLFAVSTNGYFEVYFYWYKYRPPFDTAEKRLELLARLNRISGVNLPQEVIDKRPSIILSVFSNSQALSELLTSFEWLIQEIKSM